MKAKNLLLVLAVGAAAAGCSTGSLNQTSATLKTASDTASFYFGYMYGMNMQNMGVKELNMDAIVAGINSAQQKKEVGTQPQEMNMFLNSYLQKIFVEQAASNAEKGKKFLEENLDKPGVDTLANGIQYKVIKTGDGPKPTADDVVKVHYRGTLIDGTEFDSSIERGEPATFRVSGVIPGWTTALQSMPVGSKWQVFIPSDQAYGPRGVTGGVIGPNETLIFEIELLEIEK